MHGKADSAGMTCSLKLLKFLRRSSRLRPKLPNQGRFCQTPLVCEFTEPLFGRVGGRISSLWGRTAGER